MRVVVDRVDIDARPGTPPRPPRTGPCGSRRAASASRTEPLAGSSVAGAARARSPRRARCRRRAIACPLGTRRRRRARRRSCVAAVHPSFRRIRRRPVAVVQPIRIPETPEHPLLPDFFAVRRCPLRLRRGRRGSRGARRSTLRRDRRGRARRARGRAPAQLGPADPPARRARRRRPVRAGRRRVRDVAAPTACSSPIGAALLRVPHGVPRPARRDAAHPRRDRRARGCPRPAPTTTCSPTSARCRRRSRTGSRCCGRPG